MESWPCSPEELVEQQIALGREELDLWRLSGDPILIAGCFVCFARGASGPGAPGDAGWAGAALMDGGMLVATGIATGSAPAAYAPGLLALREGPLLEAAVRALANPRRFCSSTRPAATTLAGQASPFTSGRC